MSKRTLLSGLLISFTLVQLNLKAQDCQASTNQLGQKEPAQEKKLEQLADMDFEDLMDITIVSKNANNSVNAVDERTIIISEEQLKGSSAENLLQFLKEVANTSIEEASGENHFPISQSMDDYEFILNGKLLKHRADNPNQISKIEDLALKSIKRIEIEKEIKAKDNKTVRIVRIFTKQKNMNL